MLPVLGWYLHVFTNVSSYWHSWTHV